MSQSAEPESQTAERQKEAMVEEILALGKLRPNWNGYGAEAIDAAVIERADQFAVELPLDAPRPQVVPMTRGRLQLEWHRNGRSLEIEFETPELIHYLRCDESSGIEEEAVVAFQARRKAIRLIEWFAGD